MQKDNNNAPNPFFNMDNRSCEANDGCLHIYEENSFWLSNS